MAEVNYRGRRAVQLESPEIRVTVLIEGGHIAEVLHKQTGVNPLWTPPWPSIEPSTYDPWKHPEYGGDAESRLLSGIMGHNLALHLFGGPSAEEAAAGIPVHGEASVAAYATCVEAGVMSCSAHLVSAQLEFERRLHLLPDGRSIHVHETVRNLSALDQPSAWTQHVTLGPPFLKPGVTQFRASATQSRVYERELPDGYMQRGADFLWPNVPLSAGGACDLQTYPAGDTYAGMSSHLMDPGRESAYFVAWSPESNVLFGYKWSRADFPWLALWEENCSRTAAPWNGRTITRGMEFGVSPVPETRRQMIERGSLFGVAGYRWLPAGGSVSTAYTIVIGMADQIPEEL
ncbi:MAG TPA: hypothetical protein VMZ52_14080 [Bryobacteraceae bacterium]|nr:hypothetical protein [Bryobacteraceae bacterium]